MFLNFTFFAGQVLGLDVHVEGSVEPDVRLGPVLVDAPEPAVAHDDHDDHGDQDQENHDPAEYA